MHKRYRSCKSSWYLRSDTIVEDVTLKCCTEHYGDYTGTDQNGSF